MKKTFSLLLLLLVFTSCGNRQTNSETASAEPTGEDAGPYRNNAFKGKKVYSAADTIPFGDLRLVINKAVQMTDNAVKHDRINDTGIVIGDYNSTDIYVTIHNKSDKPLEMPYIFFEDDGSDSALQQAPIVLGSRLFIESHTKKILESFSIPPRKSIEGYYHATHHNNSAIIKISYGTDEYDDKESPGYIPIPDAYKGLEVLVNLSGKIQDVTE
jgi:hypothetical protein